MAQLIILLPILVHLVCSQPSWTTNWEDDFDQFTYLDGMHKYKLYWSHLDNDIIQFGIEAETTGWIALGISPNGQMPDSDIALGWVDDTDGTVYLQDRYASERSRPTLDAENDLTLISGEQLDEWTRIKYTRPKYLCNNDDDSSIKQGTTRFIYAFNQNDPVGDDDDSILEHTYKGSQSLSMDSEGYDLKSDLNFDELDYIDIAMNDFVIPHDTDTTYHCLAFELPKFNETQHIVAFMPIITAGNEETVHHMILYSCPSDVFLDELVAGMEGNCKGEENMAECSEFAWEVGWAIGSKGMVYPDHVGNPMGGNHEGAFLYGTLEIHYDNQDLTEGILDSSGFRVWYTDELREYDSSTVGVAINLEPLHFIPPGIKRTVNYAYCSSTCTETGIPEEGVKIFGSGLHGHTAAVALRLRHIRHGEELEAIDTNWNYDFNYQQGVYFEDEITFLPGDELILECYYSTKDREDVTYEGWGTYDEMCQVYLLVYPRPSLAWCFSMFTLDSMNRWLYNASEYGYISKSTNTVDSLYELNLDWTADDNDDQECGEMFYNQLWESDEYDLYYEFCTDRHGNLLSNSILTNPIREGTDFTKYEYDQSHYGGCDIDVPTTTLTTVSFDEMCLSVTDGDGDGVIMIHSRWNSIIIILISLTYFI